MKFGRFITMIVIIVLAGMAHACAADAPAQLVETLRTQTGEWHTVFAGLHYLATVSVQRPNETDEVYECEYHQPRSDMWRLDIRRNGPGSLMRDRDFWFSVDGGSAGRYDRLGFDDAAIASIGTSLQSQNTLLASSTHLLDISLMRFVNMPEVHWESVEASVSPESQHRLRWTLTPTARGGYRPAFGAIEWVLDENQALLTHYEYYFGNRDKNDPKGVVVDVSYDRFQGRLLPSRSTRTESGVQTVTLRGQTSTAETNAAFYSPAAFGLVRPSKPWRSFEVWALLGVVSLSVGFGLRWWRTRTVRYSN